MKQVRKYKLVPINDSNSENSETPKSVQTGGETKSESPEKHSPTPEEPVKTGVTEEPVKSVAEEEPVEKVERIPPPGIPLESISPSEEDQWQTGKGEEKLSDLPVPKITKVSKSKTGKETLKKKKTAMKKKPHWISL